MWIWFGWQSNKTHRATKKYICRWSRIFLVFDWGKISDNQEDYTSAFFGDPGRIRKPVLGKQKNLHGWGFIYIWCGRMTKVVHMENLKISFRVKINICGKNELYNRYHKFVFNCDAIVGSMSLPYMAIDEICFWIAEILGDMIKELGINFTIESFKELLDKVTKRIGLFPFEEIDSSSLVDKIEKMK